MDLYTPTNCPLWTFSSRFHGVLTDHKVPMQRVSCSCGWISESSIDGLYGSSMHPFLLEKQAKQGGEESYDHISMKFKNIAIPEEHKALYDKVKWHLWHGKSESGLIRLEQLKCLIKDESIVRKLDKLSTYINNNKEGIINYGTRKRKGLSYTSNLAESTVNTLINDRCIFRRILITNSERC